MNQDTPVNTDSKLPSWYEEIFPAAPHDGFFHKFGNHAACFVDRGHDRLVVSFDNLSDAGYPHPDIEPWAGDFVRKNGWSHLGVFSRGPSWYRDQGLIDFLEGLRDQGFFKRFKGVSLIGTSMGGFAALTFASLAPGAVVVALSPQTTLDTEIVPWEVRFQKGQVQDWSLAYSDAADHTREASKVYVLYDPFLHEDRRHIERLPQHNMLHLKGFGFGHKSAVVLRRMDQLKPVMRAAIEGELTEAEFYRLIRDRKNIYLYRRQMEAHLTARGHETLIKGFVSAFQRRRRKVLAEAAEAGESEAETPGDQDFADPEPPPQQPAAAPAPAPETAPVAPPAAAPAPVTEIPPARWPEGVNAWMAEMRGPRLCYLSDRYRGEVMGFEEEDGVTLAQTPPVAIGVLAFGGVSPAERALPEDFPFHVVDEALTGHGAPVAARAQAVAADCLKRAAARPLRTMIALSELQPGATAAEAEPGAPLYTALITRVEAARAALERRGKRLFVDRIALRLLSGAPETPERAAKTHYVSVGRELRVETAKASGQASFPLLVLNQGAGSRSDGRSEVILAEGRLEAENPTTGFVMASPTYPFRLMPGMGQTILPEDQLILDELDARAVAEIQRGNLWHCPMLRYARLKARTITAEFSAMGDLEFDKGVPHGFALEGCENGAKIASVKPEGTEVRVVCNKAPEGADLCLTYAWGMTADGSKDRTANRGGLREAWAQPSVLVPGRTLHRHALAGRVKVNEEITWPKTD